ncbi:hypothetical protein PBI_GAIA_141 [Mycobacterium phage Gaia]|uniref:Uncharacterized protein n=1 Tax=Mycobacterium phage Gaia TaxID=1486472 RepID=A0A068F8X1_9CAUD|nr:hypothetical protein VC46_gp092 [Mycobacterium phage Gaia]AID58960.1 hypothetical protein PBI_GAIA_141 [Mycobacterium phage Gaia]
MASHSCSVCGEPFDKGEPRITVSGQPLHPWCDLSESAPSFCDVPGCGFRWTYHRGECVV